jgi:peptidoglycan hydrolase-like protein with peptidoglycan-binding domain
MKNKIFKTLFLLAAVGLFTQVDAASLCNFTRKLGPGSVGEDVRCLQNYLNISGFPIALSGAGSLGHETNNFKDLTKQAVKAWQRSVGLKDDGIFGAKSIAKALSLSNNSSSSSSSTSNGIADDLTTASLRAEIANLKSQLATASKTTYRTEEDKEAIEAIKKAISMLWDAEEQIEEAEDDGYDVDEAYDLLEEAEEKLEKAEDEFDDEDYDKAIDYAKDAIDLAEEAIDAIED